MRTLLNLALFQLGWLACVVGAAAGRPWLGVGVVGIVLGVHVIGPGRPNELPLVAASAALGIVADSALRASGLVLYAAAWSPSWLAPVWIVAMWANFAITLDHSLSWLSRRPFLAAALGALGGPLAYVAGSRLGAVELRPWSLAALAAIWAVALPLLTAWAGSRRA